ncbi:unnamed protein product [Owenia fusiformis]|uniref:Uncharacterized protein n=1 Tax=Owenia fusiformis TaxID=6347 RepID=A0A8J1THA3_OWEFU|nr:unnamed protein product [Owenia fusiformis]
MWHQFYSFYLGIFLILPALIITLLVYCVLGYWHSQYKVPKHVRKTTCNVPTDQKMMPISDGGMEETSVAIPYYPSAYSLQSSSMYSSMTPQKKPHPSAYNI